MFWSACMKQTRNVWKCQELIITQKGIYYIFFSYYESYYQLIGTDLSRQVNTSIPKQNNLTEKLEKSSLHIGSIRTFCPKKSGKKIDKIHKGF